MSFHKQITSCHHHDVGQLPSTRLLPDNVAKIANNKEHKALPTSANMTT